MDELLRLVESCFRGLLHARGGNAPALVDFRHDFEGDRDEWRDRPRFRHLFTARFSDGSRERFCVPAESPQDRYSIDLNWLRGDVRRLYSRLYEEHMRQPFEAPSRGQMTRNQRRRAPVSIGIDWAYPVTMNVNPADQEELRREMLRPGGVVWADADEVFYGGPRGRRRQREVNTATVAPLEPPDTLTLEIIQRTMVRAREAMEGQCPCDACQARRMQRREREAGRPDPFEKSLTLLREWLSPSQLAQYDKEKFFDVTGSTGKRYRIDYGNAANVKEYDEAGKIVANLCFQPAGAAGIYAGDTMLAQKIMLENDEPAALKVANRSEVGAARSAAMRYAGGPISQSIFGGAGPVF